ncbi:Cytoplasmic tRNA 2-thiolation protein 2 [Candida viswanathii]|uniref:Cytoplasmic tRNA 2-thiolation protein 2 n=1 Tax=Candida viswanathii TaxID=5486 RepID=A0A367XZQ4_9ASCO|nr:Cytoplasmic tRNA 2-thiolation protein 2 [Candida viswanathii]
MPEAIVYLTETKTCPKCKTQNAVVHARGEDFCGDCYIFYFRGKLRKQINEERYKVKFGKSLEIYGTQKVLLALSGGESSIVLLDIIGALLEGQNKQHRGKQGFELVLVNLDESELDSLNKKLPDVLPKLLERYSPVNITFKVLSLNSYVDESTLHKISLTPEFTALSKSVDPHKTTLIELLKKCPNKSSAEDLLTIVYESLILRVAAEEGCQTILYGHCMTRLANEIIALTVKGRGSVIHKAIADHIEVVDSKDIKVMFPLREILHAEIAAYVKLAELQEFVVGSTIEKSKINRNLTIRDLTTNYFKQLDATGYASTASTVVKTGEKLGAPKGELLGHCQVCGADIHQDPSTWLRTITVNDPAPIETEEERGYLEMYQTSLQNTQEQSVASGEPLNVCFGCIITLGGVKQDSGFLWPIEGKSNLEYLYVNESQEKQKVLDEFVLTDGEEE